MVLLKSIFPPLSLGEGLGVRLLFACLLLSSCSADSSFRELLPGDPVEIVLAGGLGQIGSDVTPDTRALIDGSNALTLSFARRDKRTDADSWLDYGNTVLSATRVAGSNNQKISFDTPQYYPMEKAFGNASSTSYNETRLIGWYPKESSISGGVVKINMNGTEDILLSNEVTGSYTNPFTSSQKQLLFSHLLTKVTVQVKAGDAQAPGIWGTVTSIKVKNQPSTCDITLPTTADATIGWTGNTASFSLEGMSNKTLTSDYQPCGTALVRPTGNQNMVLEVTTLNGGTRDITFTLTTGTFVPGSAYTLSLVFHSTDILPYASIGAWQTGDPVSDGNMKV